MGIREPGALTKAIDQLRTDLRDSDTEIRVTMADADSLLVVLETAREMARHEVVIEWLEWAAQTVNEPEAFTDAAEGLLLRALDELDQPFEHGLPPKEIEALDLCGEVLNEGVFCTLAAGHTQDHKADSGERWVRTCGSVRYDGVVCNGPLDHVGEHSHIDADGKGVSW